MPANTASAGTSNTILTWVERRFGFAVAQAYAGHQDAARGARAMSATGTYVRAGLPEVATALAVLTGEPHPLAPEGASADDSPKPADEEDHRDSSSVRDAGGCSRSRGGVR